MKRHALSSNPRALSHSTQVSNEILEILRRPISYVPPSIRISRPAKEFQFFEVLSAYIMSLIESDFEWTVTPLQHDNGVDFYGERALFRLPGLETPVTMVIAGQCKASKNVKTPLPSDLWGLLNAVKPSIVFIFLMTNISRKRIGHAQDIFTSETNRQCRILGLNEIIRLIQLYRADILHLLHQSLSSRDEGVLRTFIERLPTSQSDNIEVKTRLPEKALAGTPFYVHVNVHSVLLCKNTLRVRWNHSPDILLIKPTELVAPDGFLIEAGVGFCSTLSLKLISYYVGEVSLGELVFEAEGSPIKTVPLGSLSTVDQYHPIFFWEPYHHHRIRFFELLEKAEAHAPEGGAITGQGGAGKTRFCQELGYFAEQRGGEFISVSHPQDLEHPYRIFALLAQELLSDPFDALNPQESLESYIQSLHSKLYQRAKGTIAMIFSNEDRGGCVFDREAMIQLLLVMLLQKAKTTTYVLHFSDLHWASAEALGILGDLLQRLRKMVADCRASVLFLFEGRVQTNLKYTDTRSTSAQMTSTVIFESFIDRYQLERFDVKPFSTAQSYAFLTHLFENAQSANRRVPKELIPQQELLIGEIARYGQGNPFHMVEQIKLLRQAGLLARNQRTGLIFLTGPPLSSYQVPTSVYDLISLRLKFIEDSSPELGLLIKSVGLIKDRLNAQLFRKLHRSLANHTPDSAIQEIEILNIDTPSEIRFRHENYYQVVRDFPLKERERQKITEVYLDWYRDLRPKTAEVLYEEALVHTNCLQMKLPVIKSLLTKGLKKAETYHQYQLAIQIIEKLLYHFPAEITRDSTSVAGLIANFKLRIKLADFSHDLQDWNLGAEQHTRVIADIDHCLEKRTHFRPTLRSTLDYLRTSSMVDLANCQTDLGRSHQSVYLLTDARKTCDTYFKLGLLANDKEQDLWSVLYGRVLNRLGEANWMDGNYSEALKAFQDATSVIESKVRRPKDRLLLHHINYLDYGAVLLHQNPAKAVEMLTKSLSLVPEKGCSPHLKILAGTTVIIGEMVQLFLQDKGNSLRFRRFLENRAIPQLQGEFERAMFYGFKQEQVAASLMIGVSLSLLNDQRAIQWYMESIETSLRSNNLESLWRGHLNLAQFLASGGETEACFFHCNRARQLLSKDLQGRAPHERVWRQRHLARPLAQIARILPQSELMADLFICTVLEQIKAEPVIEGLSLNRAFFSDKIIFFWDQGNEYYPYGG